VGRSHLAGLHDLAHVAVEKVSILTGLTDQGLAVVNADSEQLDRALLAYNCNTIRFGLADSAALRLTGCTALEKGQRIEINGRFCMDMAIPGRHNALNALAAMAVAQRFGMDYDEIAASLADFTGLESRLEFIHLPSGTIIDDTYNANPDSFMAAAAVLADCRARRRVIIAGDMLELGQKSQSLHLETGRDLAASGVDLLIGVGPLGRYIAEGAAKKGTKTEAFDSQGAAAAALSKLLHAGDTVLVKGSRAMEMERLIKPIKSALGSRRPRAKKVSVAKKAKAKKKVKARKKAKKTTTP
jgi:UDP-N-acetylmuramoyl-tripeptide--D-alanyl-D-alanine ligase